MYEYGQKLIAARARHKDGATWPEAAATIGANESTLRLWDANDDADWRKAEEETFNEIRREGRGIAWRGLLGAAKDGDVQACKEVLNRAEGAVAQKQELTGANGGPVQTQQIVSPEQLALMASREVDAHGSGDTGGN